MSKLFVDEIVHQSSQGSGTITIGASGEKVDLGTGVSGGTLTNRPAFYAYPSGTTQSLSASTWTKVVLDSTFYDTDNGFDTTNSKYTIPAQKAGKYFLNCNSLVSSVENGKLHDVRFYKNGTAVTRTYARETLGVAQSSLVQSIYVDEFSAGDYLELYIRQTSSTSKNLNKVYVYFSGFRLIGV